MVNNTRNSSVPPVEYEPTSGVGNGVQIFGVEVQEHDEIEVNVEANKNFENVMPETFTVERVCTRNDPTDGSVVIQCEHPDFTVEVDDYTQMVSLNMNRPAVEGLVVDKVVTNINKV